MKKLLCGLLLVLSSLSVNASSNNCSDADFSMYINHFDYIIINGKYRANYVDKEHGWSTYKNKGYIYFIRHTNKNSYEVIGHNEYNPKVERYTCS